MTPRKPAPLLSDRYASHARRMALAQIQRWEIGGVAMGPLVLAFATSSFPARFGWTAEDVYEMALLLASLVAVLRAWLDSRKATTLQSTTTAVVAEPVVLPVADAVPKSAAEATTRRIEGASDA